MITGGIVAVLLVYFMVTRPTFPSKETFTWTSLLSFYGMGFYAGASIVAGWKLMQRFTARTFLFLPIIGWVIYLFLKIAFSLFVGTYFYGVFRFFNNLFQIHKINNQLENDL